MTVKEARRLLDALASARRAIAIAKSPSSEVLGNVRQLALERCVEMADEAIGREAAIVGKHIDETIMLQLSSLRYLISRDYQQVDPKAVRKSVLEIMPALISKIEPLEEQLYRSAKLKRPPQSNRK